MSARSNDGDASARERLRVAYGQFWNNAVTLSREIQKSVPNLTLHDEAHFNSLWERADQIAGPEYEFTPLEVFVLGGSILLHDAANSVASFAGGIDEIKASPEWRDAAAEWIERQTESSTSTLPISAEESVLFETLRALHAQRAETIASMEVVAGVNRFYLIGDDQLRTHLGNLIGKVAASHHWNVSNLVGRLPGRRGSLSGMPVDWTIRPVLIACLLRCADATQLDQNRAPDFLYGLLKLRGVSESHWRAQNRLATPLVDSEDSHALRFTSTMPFGVEDADAWWIAFDAIQVANRELQSVDSLLRDLRMPPFLVNRVWGAETPQRLAEQVNASGWRPVAAEVKVSRTDKIVDLFGGENLYGHHMVVPLRELIQNAADAVFFRRELEPLVSRYEGAITVRLVEMEEGGAYALSVEDDGLGMSEAVLTGPLIDFGSSYVSSSLVKTEYPGLLSKRRKRLGMFGIGFFSCFMITDNVTIASRPFDRGIDQCRTLIFKNGIIARPLLLDERPQDYSASTSTRVTLKVSTERLNEMLTTGKSWGRAGTLASLEQLVGAICPMLDADVFVEHAGKRTLIHPRRWMAEDRFAWLKRLRLPDGQTPNLYDAYLQQAEPLLDFIDPEDPSAGLACITGMGGGGVATVGTLRATPSFGNDYRDDFIGAIDYLPSDPRRSEGKARAQDRLPDWATRQAKKVAEAGIPFPQRQNAAQTVANLGGDATPIAGMLLNREWVGIEGIFDHLAEGNVVYAPIKSDMHDNDRILATQIRERHSGFLDNYQTNELELLVSTIEVFDSSGGNALYLVPTELEGAKFSIFSLLEAYSRERGYSVVGKILDRVEFAKYVGLESARDGLEYGKIIATHGLQLSIIRI